jgi:ankyrin repeat protein
MSFLGQLNPFSTKEPMPNIISFQQATYNGNDKAIRAHLELDPSFIKDKEFMNIALFKAAERGHMKVAALLIEKGADVHAKDALSGRTPLHIAAMRGNTEFAALILAVSPEAASAENNGGTAIDLSHLDGLDAAIVRAVAAAAARRRMPAMAALLKAKQSRRGGKRATRRRKRHSRRR